MKGESILAKALPWVGLLTAAGSAVAKAYQNNEWFQSLLATSVVAFWGNVIARADEERKHRTRIDATLKAISPVSGDPLDQMLREVLRASSFGGCQIDARFWAEYGRFILLDESRSAEERLADVIDARDRNLIRVEDPHQIYQLMATLLGVVGLAGEDYLATATVSEMRHAEAREFILDFPFRHKGAIKRIICGAPEDLEKAAPDAVRRIREITQHDPETEIRFLRRASVSNFGVYGSIAVGELAEPRMENAFHFAREHVQARRSEFFELWNKAVPLD